MTAIIERRPYRCARGHRCHNAAPVVAPCPCECHGMPAQYARCDVEGGCGHLHEPDEAAELEGGPILTHAGLCDACARRVEQALAELPVDYVELHHLLASGESGLTEVIVSGSEELKVPLRLSVEALQSSMVHESVSWAEPVAERLGIDWDSDAAKHSRPGFVLQRASRLLGNALDALLALPGQEYRHHSSGEWVERDGIGGALELLRLHDLTRFAAGKTKLIHRLPAPCPRCEAMTLVRHNGDDQVQCEQCGVRWPEKDYRRLTLVLADDCRDEVPDTSHLHLVASDEGTTGSAAGGFVPYWPQMPMVEFPEREPAA